MKLFTFLLVFAFSYSFGIAQNNFKYTRTLSDSTLKTTGYMEKLSWLQGTWHGEAFGGHTEEIWSAPNAGSMMFSFKLTQNNTPVFYEFGFILEQEGTLVLKLKHFNPDLTGWEEKNKFVEFKLVEQSENIVWFEGFTIEKINNDEINMYVRIDDENKVEEVKFNYHRAKLAH